jgi:signal transduction histidine kinase/ActR/RegA family two-component response regulator
MGTQPREIRAEPHSQIGAILQRDAGALLQRWARRAAEEQPDAKRAHHDVLLDHLSAFLREMGRSLAEADADEYGWHRPPAREHGKQRWENGWSLAEVVRDYQVLRLVMLDYLEEALDRPLLGREVMAVGLALDEAIAASVTQYGLHQQAALLQAERERAASDKRAADERHRREAEALREAERRKDEFLALLGHELRNPLAPLQNALHVLRLRGADPPTVAWAQDVADRQVRQLTRLVDDLLDVSRIARGKLLLRRERVDLVRLVGNLVEDHRRTAGEANLTLAVELPPAPVWVRGDPVRLAQVVGNLLHNAVKFTGAGGSVTVRVTSDEDGKRTVVTVRDTGIGIDPDTLPLLFQMYTQAERGLQRSRGGLGLALVKGLVELHGGEVQAASAGPGQGAELSVRLPLDQGAEAPAGPPPSEEVAGRALRILIVEDNRDAAEALRVLLELSRHQVVVAHDGPGAIEAARALRPEVVLCDLGLPKMDGYAVARALRQDPALAATRLIATSGYGSEADQQKSREAGFEAHLIKPVDPDELQRVLGSVEQGS